MKTTAIHFLLSTLLLTVSSCKKDQEVRATCGSCAPQSQAVKTVTDAEGIVGFDATSQQYYISKHEPGTYDVVDVGVVCRALPQNLQTTGLKVFFSGIYKQYGRQPFAPAGYTYSGSQVGVLLVWLSSLGDGSAPQGSRELPQPRRVHEPENCSNYYLELSRVVAQ